MKIKSFIFLLVIFVSNSIFADELPNEGFVAAAEPAQQSEIVCGKPAQPHEVACGAPAAPDAISEATSIPRNVGIIPDGNRRWSKERGLTLLEGYRKASLEVVPELTDFLWKQGVHTVSMWCFSTENWQRSGEEVESVMTVIKEGIEIALLPLARRMNARIIHLGRKDRIPEFLLTTINAAEAETQKNEAHAFNLCVDYSGQDEICRMVTKLIESGVAASEVTIERCASALDTATQPYPLADIVVRSSGEQRLSGFMPLQTASSELYFISKLFPDCTTQDMQDMLSSFAQRDRRFGK